MSASVVIPCALLKDTAAARGSSPGWRRAMVSTPFTTTLSVFPGGDCLRGSRERSECGGGATSCRGLWIGVCVTIFSGVTREAHGD